MRPYILTMSLFESAAHARIARRVVFSGALVGLAALFRPMSAEGEQIEFIADALTQILRWAQSAGVSEPPAWRLKLPYELAREQAKWSGSENPDLEVERQLRTIREQKQKNGGMPMLERTATLADQIMNGRDEFLRTALPHVRSYLPPGTPIRGTVALAAFLPNYAFSMNNTIVVSLTDRFWGSDPARVFNLLIHELFHYGFISYQRGESPADSSEGAALVRTVLWFIQNEGLATYVAYRAKPTGLTLNDYRLLDDQEEVRRRFEMARGLIQDFERATSGQMASLKDRMSREGNQLRVSYIVGAAMARRIEQVDGRGTLLKTIEGGPQIFLEAYRATSPSAELSI